MTRPFSLVIFSVCFLNVFSLVAQDSRKVYSREDYINMCKPFVMQKMRDFGIPASISLAQAMVESGNGNSMLARDANNHFGIKCHDWIGPTYSWHDDEKDECFRKYASAEESFHDHSLFLLRRPRYAGLFEIDVSDYKSWAHGLRKAGYATNPQYPQMLIKIIEENRLFELDQEVLHGQVAGDFEETNTFAQTFAAASFTEFGPGPANRTLFLNNRRLFVFTRTDDTYFKIANDFNINLANLCYFNDIETGTEIRSGYPVFIEHKKKRSKIAYHEVQKNETLYEIAQHYGIKLKHLYRYNAVNENYRPKPGERIKLR